MTIILAALAFILGTCIGSFLGAINYRLKSKKKGFIMGRSICPNCKKKLSWYHLFPIFSYLALGGKCAKCKKPISAYYPLIELTTGLTYLTLLLIYTITAWPFLLFYGLLFTFLIGIFFYDLRYQEIPDSYSIPAIIISIIGNYTLGIVSLQSMLFGAAAIGGFFALQFILSRGRWIGGGDIRLGLLLGTTLGLTHGGVALFIAYVLGSIVGLSLMAFKKANGKTLLPFGPFLIIGLTIALTYSEKLISWYQSLFLI